MCLIVFAYDCHPVYRLVLGANRDEFRDRPTDTSRFWSDAPYILAGRDKVRGGTWLGVTTDGKVAAVTNYRDPRQYTAGSPSRGNLVAGYLRSKEMTTSEFQGVLARDAQRYNGFNLLYGTPAEFHYFTNRGGSSAPVSPGVHALSNHLLDTRWPKVTAARSRLETIMLQTEIDPEQMFAALSDPTPFAAYRLPDTGVGPERERLLSPVFIENDVYGTRSTTVLLIDRSGRVTFAERTFDRPSMTSATEYFKFTIEIPGR